MLCEYVDLNKDIEMKIYWTLKSIPEFSQLSSDERGRRWRSAYQSVFRHWETWAGLALIGFLGAAGSHFFGALGAIVLAGTGGFMYGQITIYVARKYYRYRLLDERN